jgi:hypothetical protein
MLCAGAVCAKPVVDKADEAKGYLLEKPEIPGWVQSFTKLSEWRFVREPKTPPVTVGSVVQRWWHRTDEAEVIVEAAMFPSQADALLAAEQRVNDLTRTRFLEPKMLKGGQLPGQGKGDRVWGLFDPPETTGKMNPSLNKAPITQFAAVVFVKKEVAVHVSSHSYRKSINLDDLEHLAKKIALKIKTAPQPPRGARSRDTQERHRDACSLLKRPERGSIH